MDIEAPSENTTSLAQEEIEVTVHHHGKLLSFTLSATSSLSDLSTSISTALSIPPTNQKLLVSPKHGLLKPPFTSKSGSPILLSSLPPAAKITLVGTTTAEINSLDSAASAAISRNHRRPGSGPIKPATPTRTRDWKRAKEDAEYTFHTIRPLPYFHNPSRAHRFLEQLANDPGIRATMRSHRFSVGLLTEMDPAMHTTHESRTLGLNRNAGEVIELRLRTDAGDGFRDYKVIRNTLCHELAHNVHGPHDRNFWELCKAIEKEVEREDWSRGGHRLTDEEFYNPEDRGLEDAGIVDDHGGWTGGEYVLGRGDGRSSSTETAGGQGALGRREIIAKAAEERMKKEKNLEKEKGNAREERGSSS
ncbi:WLM-domain-containing protein [Aulographum hederae CBS 113979]|uniref:WLM-domain-containing protein n=1 Tax=Aulographum hederae CBS 113979 TaxID=1176131 RepID=A0A6G1HC43_9PEZI|nr:WLM-domain-containing protein [Aulographum hederae CBS 113979]